MVMVKDPQEDRFADLTLRQAEVMDLLTQHMTSKQIGAELGISPKTVDLHIEAARGKLGAPDRMSAARLWREGHREQFPRRISRVDHPPQSLHPSLRDLPTSPLFTVSDAAAFGDWPVPVRRRPVLEALDARFGKFGRVIAIVVLAGLMAMTIVLSLSIAEGLDKLI